MLTRDQVVTMAEQAGLAYRPALLHSSGEAFAAIRGDANITDELVEFAALVAAAERKTCDVATRQALEYAKAAEREACAKVAEKHRGIKRGNEPVVYLPSDIADAIRARKDAA